MTEEEEMDCRRWRVNDRKEMFKYYCRELRDSITLYPTRPAWADEVIKELNEIEILVMQEANHILERVRERREAFEELPRIYTPAE